MPNIDSGSYFLTALFPIRNFSSSEHPYVEIEIDDGQIMRLLPSQAVRHVLSVGATAQQGPATYWQYKDGKRIRATNNSHFADNLRTHFARFFVIDNAVYNGRNPSDVLFDTIKGLPVIGRLFGKPTNLLDPQPVDKLSHHYLAWVTEIDAPEGKEEELDSYLEGLWNQIPEKLAGLFIHCHGFDPKSMNAENFRKFVRLAQVETVMPFHDYWKLPPELGTFLKKGHSLATKTIGALGALATIIAFIGFAIHFFKWLFWDAGGTSWWLGFFLISLIITLLVVYRDIMKYGSLPFPKAPNSDLPSVLKSLYLQQRFSDFAQANQTGDANNLHSEFGKFLALHKPEDLNEPTQPAGTICKNEENK